MFSDSRCKNACNCLQICAHVFINRPQNCASLGHSRSKLCPILCCLRTKLCPNFGRSYARLCPISFAPCPFPNLAGTLIISKKKTESQTLPCRPPRRIHGRGFAEWSRRGDRGWRRHVAAPGRTPRASAGHPCHSPAAYHRRHRG